jgi:Ca2+-binding RTX toxin-like protein
MGSETNNISLSEGVQSSANGLGSFGNSDGLALEDDLSSSSSSSTFSSPIDKIFGGPDMALSSASIRPVASLIMQPVENVSAASIDSSTIDQNTGSPSSDGMILQGSGLNNVLEGALNNDTISGGSGDDIITGNAGTDLLYGNSGADIFRFVGGDALNTFDLIRDFNASEGDALDISDLIEGFVPGTSNIEDYVSITESGVHSHLRIDVDGGGDDFSTILARIDNTLNLDVEAMFNAGTIAVTGDQIINGTSGVDVIFGLDGDDVINTGAGRDIIFGGAGADTFDFRAGALATFDIVHDFSSSDGDIIDISTIISNFPNDGTDNILDYVRFTEVGEYSYLRVDSNGGRDDFSTIVARLNGTGYDVWDLFFNGQIAVTGDDIYNGARDHVLNSVFYGLDGDDAFSLYHPDREIMDGGSGADTFSFLDNSNYNRTFDIIRGFDANEGDVLKLENVVSYSDPIEDIINDFVRITEAGGNSFVRVDQTGNGIFNAVDIRLDGVTGLNVQDLLENGNIIV